MKNKIRWLYLLKTFVLIIAYLLTSSSPVLASADLLTHLHPQYAKVAGGQIEYYRFGSGPPLVMITGYLANVRGWNKSLLEALAKKNEVIIFDNRDVGGSTFTSPSYQASDLAADVYHLCQTLHLSHVNLLGISMGGMIAQKTAADYPKLVNKLILINTAIAGLPMTKPSTSVQNSLMNPPHGFINHELTALHILFPPGTRVKMFFAIWGDRFNPGFKEKPMTRAVVMKQQNLIMAWETDKISLNQIRHLKMPVLLLSGGKDAVIPYQNMNVLKKNLSRAYLLRWPNGGHIMIYQYPKSIANAINSFLAD